MKLLAIFNFLLVMKGLTLTNGIPENNFSDLVSLTHSNDADGANDNLLHYLLQRVNALETIGERQQIIEKELRSDLQKLQNELNTRRLAVLDLEAENKRHAQEIWTLKSVCGELEGGGPVGTNGAVVSDAADVLDRSRKAADGAHVSFFAKLDRNLAHLAPNATVAFDVVEVNIGWAYDPQTGHFTAPVNGVYVFSTTLTTFSVFQINCGLAVNGDWKTHLWINGADQSFGSSGQTVILQLNGGDRVTVQQGDAEAYVEGDGHSLFSGFLLF